MYTRISFTNIIQNSCSEITIPFKTISWQIRGQTKPNYYYPLRKPSRVRMPETKSRVNTNPPITVRDSSRVEERLGIIDGIGSTQPPIISIRTDCGEMNSIVRLN